MSNDPAVELVRALIEHLRGAEDHDWASLAMVVDLGGSRVRNTSGFTYSPDAVAAVASRPSGIQPAVQAFLESRYPEGEDLPVTFLLQFERTTGRYEVVFEDTDPARWKVTPANLDDVREVLRPRFD